MGKDYIFCMNCGQKLPADANFCLACGQRVETGGCQNAAGAAPETVPCRQEDMDSPAETVGTLTLAEFRAQAPSRTGFREQLLAYRKSLPHNWDYNAYVGILLGVRGPKHGDAACMNFAIGQGDNGNNTKKTLDAKGLMPVFEKYKGKDLDAAILLSDVEDEILAIAPDYAAIRDKFHEIVLAEAGRNGKAAEDVSAPQIPAAPTEDASTLQISAVPEETDPSWFSVEDCAGGCRIEQYFGLNIGGKLLRIGAVIIPSHIGAKKVVEIGKEAFAECGRLTSITIPDGVTEIGEEAFYNCESLTSITIPKGVTKISASVFSSCKNLTSVTIPNGVTEIGRSAFFGCTSLISINIPGSVTKIGGWAFRHCKSLTSLTIPASVTQFGEDAFGGDEFFGSKYLGGTRSSDKLTIYAPAGSAVERYAKKYGIPFRPLAGTPAAPAKVQAPAPSYFEVEACAGGCRIKKYTGRGGSVVIPSHIGGKKVVEIGEEAFAFCRSLTSLTIPDGVMKIGKDAFEHCANLTSITIPGSVTDIVLGTFFGCDNLTVHAPAGSYAAQCPAVWWFPVQPL